MLTAVGVITEAWRNPLALRRGTHGRRPAAHPRVNRWGVPRRRGESGLGH